MLNAIMTSNNQRTLSKGCTNALTVLLKVAAEVRQPRRGTHRAPRRHLNLSAISHAAPRPPVSAGMLWGAHRRPRRQGGSLLRWLLEEVALCAAEDVLVWRRQRRGGFRRILQRW